MSESRLFIIALSVFPVLVSLVIIAGCITTPAAPGSTTPPSGTISLPSSGSPLPAPASNPAGSIQLEGNIYGISSNPQVGIDTITFTIGLPLKAPEVDLTRMEIVFSTPVTAPVILTHGTRESTSTFTTTRGNYAIASLRPMDEVEVSFRVRGVPAGTAVNVELKPAAGVPLRLSVTVPSMLYSTNILS
jgi:archaellin